MAMRDGWNERNDGSTDCGTCRADRVRRLSECQSCVVASTSVDDE